MQKPFSAIRLAVVGANKVLVAIHLVITVVHDIHVCELPLLIMKEQNTRLFYSIKFDDSDYFISILNKQRRAGEVVQPVKCLSRKDESSTFMSKNNNKTKTSAQEPSNQVPGRWRQGDP